MNEREPHHSPWDRPIARTITTPDERVAALEARVLALESKLEEVMTYLESPATSDVPSSGG